MDLFSLDNTKEIFFFLEQCKDVKQSSLHHPEGDVLVHSLQTFYNGVRESSNIDLLWAALLHDIGKKVNSLGHEQIGSILLQDYCSVKTLFLIEHHMRIWSYINGEMKKLSKCEYLVSHPWLPELVQLARWDKMSRDPNKKVVYDKDKILTILNKKIDNHFKLPEGKQLIEVGEHSGSNNE